MHTHVANAHTHTHTRTNMHTHTVQHCSVEIQRYALVCTSNNNYFLNMYEHAFLIHRPITAQTYIHTYIGQHTYKQYILYIHTVHRPTYKQNINTYLQTVHIRFADNALCYSDVRYTCIDILHARHRYVLSFCID